LSGNRIADKVPTTGPEGGSSFCFCERITLQIVSVKRHSAAALALVGWYLMTPPLTPKGVFDSSATLVDGSAPISQWSVSRSFDSAERCEQAREAAENVLKQAVKKNPDLLGDRDPKRRLETMGILAAAIAKCIATDDPRLKPE
jgi:hypothetical protein